MTIDLEKLQAEILAMSDEDVAKAVLSINKKVGPPKDSTPKKRAARQATPGSSSRQSVKDLTGMSLKELRALKARMDATRDMIETMEVAEEIEDATNPVADPEVVGDLVQDDSDLPTLEQFLERTEPHDDTP